MMEEEDVGDEKRRGRGEVLSIHFLVLEWSDLLVTLSSPGALQTTIRMCSLYTRARAHR